MVHTPVFDDVVAPRLPGERGFGFVEVPGGDLPLEEVSFGVLVADDRGKDHKRPCGLTEPGSQIHGVVTLGH